MNASGRSRIVFSGGAGVGKTAVLIALQALGHTVVGDSARSIVQARKARGLSPRPGADQFAQEVLLRDVENYKRHTASSGLIFFDRSVVDALGMLDQVSPLSEVELNHWLSGYPYQLKVFVFPPWEAIYANDEERDHTFEHVQMVDCRVREWYRRCRYEIVEVPRLSVAGRCAFVLGNLEAGVA